MPAFSPYSPGAIYQAQNAGPDLDTPQGAGAYAESYDQYVGEIQNALQQTSGFERMKLQAQLEDAEKGRANAYKMAQLTAETTRYGIDAQRATAMAQLKENARQFDATHALDMQKFGVAYAGAATEYLSTPDRFFQAADFINMSGRALGRTADGSQGPQPYLANGQPTPKTEADFAALAGYTMPTPGQLGQPVQGSASPYPASGGGGGGATVAPPASGAPTTPKAYTDTGPAPTAPASATEPTPVYTGGAPAAGASGVAPVVTAAAGQGPGQDARAKALKAMIDAVPPSGVAGLDANDFAVLQAARALYSTNLTPGSLEKMRPGQQAIMGSAGRRLGYDVKDYLADYESAKPWQRQARAA
jgi:hypothetical protein